MVCCHKGFKVAFIFLCKFLNTLSTFLGLSRPAIDQYKGHPKELLRVETGNQKTSRLHTSWRIHPADLQMSSCTQCQYTYPPFCVELVCIVPRPSTNGLGMRLGWWQSTHLPMLSSMHCDMLGRIVLPPGQRNLCTFGWLCSSILRICTTSAYFRSLI